MNRESMPCSFLRTWITRFAWAVALSASVASLMAGELSQDTISNVGVKECAACHSSPSPIYHILGVTQFTRLVEAKEWIEQDKHAYAYELVRQDLTPEQLKNASRKSNQLSIEITNNLRWKNGDGNFEMKCLTCHVGQIGAESNDKLDVRFGVQCEACHGPGSEYTKVDNHQQSTWRTKSPQQKLALGMRDLSVPSLATPVCVSCHVGNIEQGRFVTHAMYAAGHPILPPFELETFLQAMPPHWRSLSQKLNPETVTAKPKGGFEFQSEYIRAHYDPSDATTPLQTEIQNSFRKTQRSMLGAMSTNDHGIVLIQQAAKDPNYWADYSLYNCMGCHQDLKTNRTSQNSNARIPGRPFPADWLNIDSVKVYRSKQQGSFESLDIDLASSFNAVPFGDIKQLRLAEDSQLEVLRKRLSIRERLERSAMTQIEVKQWLRNLWEARSGGLRDYWTAKQTGWLICVAIEELIERQSLDAELVTAKQKELQTMLSLNLQLPQKESVLGRQQSTLQMANTFDAARCREIMSDLIESATADR